MNTQRNYKDTVSRMIFREPGNALSLYNSLNGTHYTDTGMLEFNTLENQGKQKETALRGGRGGSHSILYPEWNSEGFFTEAESGGKEDEHL